MSNEIFRYGSHGYEMINVTYAGDTLIAFKVTGDKNVPRGEITFQADLTPFGTKSSDRNAKTEHLAPILLTEKAAKKWGTSQLPRYHGRGRVAEEGFQNAQWMEGQLIIIGEEYFSFAWVPIEHQIFFGRPSPELALKMLRDGGVSVLKHKSWNEPPSLDDDVKV
jgi:Cyclin D1 binding domain